MDKIFKPVNDMVGGIPRCNLEPRWHKPEDTMISNGKNYYWCNNHHDRVMWVFQTSESYNVKETQVEANATK